MFLPFVQLPPVNADLPGREGPWGWASVSLDCRVGPWVPDCAPCPRGRVPRSTDPDLHSSPLQGDSWGSLATLERMWSPLHGDTPQDFSEGSLCSGVKTHSDSSLDAGQWPRCVKGRSASAYPLLLPETTTLLSSSSAGCLQGAPSQSQGAFLSTPAALPPLIGGTDHAADRGGQPMCGDQHSESSL